MKTILLLLLLLLLLSAGAVLVFRSWQYYVRGLIMDGPGMVNYDPSDGLAPDTDPGGAVITGGVTDNSHDAPKEIVSGELLSLEARFYVRDPKDDARSGGYSFTLQVSADGAVTLARGSDAPVQVPGDLPKNADELIKKHDLARHNGTDRITAGLPEEYGPCSLRAEYASGEALSFCINNDPDALWALELRDLFLSAMAQGE